MGPSGDEGVVLLNRQNLPLVTAMVPELAEMQQEQAFLQFSSHVLTCRGLALSFDKQQVQYPCLRIVLVELQLRLYKGNKSRLLGPDVAQK